MTRRPAYPGQEEHLRNIGVLHSGADAAIKGTRPGSPPSRKEDLADAEQRKREVKERMREARQKLGGRDRYKPEGIQRTRRKDHAKSETTSTQAPAIPLIPTLRPFLAEEPHTELITEWDNPLTKTSLPKYEQIRRARLRAAQIAAASDPLNPVIRADIIKRDGSMCWICRKPCAANDITIDHVIPLSRKGKHIPENVRVAHAGCNSWKGDRIITPILRA